MCIWSKNGKLYKNKSEYLQHFLLNFLNKKLQLLYIFNNYILLVGPSIKYVCPNYCVHNVCKLNTQYTYTHREVTYLENTLSMATHAK